jgi:prepilin-type processing-associated H-X9-DG protein
MTGEMQRLGGQDWAQYPWGNECTSTSHDGWALGGVATLFDLNTGEINNGHFEHPGSEHPGGAHFGLADGSVRFVTENVEANIMRFWSCYKDTMLGELP